MLVITAPGQGAQTPGFLSPWLDLPAVAERLGRWSDLVGCDLIRCGTTAGLDEITDTAVAQPLLVAAGLAVAAELLGDGATPATGLVAAGHSVGELTAGALAGAVADSDALRLVRVRGTAMAAAAAAQPTGMTAVLGGDTAVVLAALDAHGLTPANVNGAGQVVAAGTAAGLAAFAADPPAGARLRPLSVAGAFHTAHMAPAVAALRAAATDVDVADPTMTLLSNADGAAVGSGTDWLARVVGQVAAPVRWDACLATMADLGVTALIELPPAGTLVGLARRGLRGATTLALTSPDDLAAARKLLTEHASNGHHASGPGRRDTARADARQESTVPEEADDDPGGAAYAGHVPEWRLLVAPLAGVFRSSQRQSDGTAQDGGPVDTDTDLGLVERRGDRRRVLTRWPGSIIEWLVMDGDLVSVGQPLARLLPEGADC